MPICPIPEWLFGWAAAVVLIVSFVALAALWPEPKLERDRWRPLPGRAGRVPGRRWSRPLRGHRRVLLLVVVVVSGLAGTQSPLDNFAPSFVFIIFWVGLAFASALFGNLFAAFSPWRALGRALAGRGPRRFARLPGAARALARGRRSLRFTWIELASEWGEDPRMLAVAVLGYTAITLAGQAVFGVETWTRRGETFAVYFDMFSRISPFERRDGVVGVRPPLAGLPRLDVVPGTVALVLVMIGTVTFDGISQGQLWKDVTGDLRRSTRRCSRGTIGSSPGSRS